MRSLYSVLNRRRLALGATSGSAGSGRDRARGPVAAGEEPPVVGAAVGEKACALLGLEPADGVVDVSVGSVLVELGCLSNPAEERLLPQRAYQQRLARGLLRAIEDYFAAHAVR